MSQPDFYAILDECLARQQGGEPMEACLADYPEHAPDLNPALAISAELVQLNRLEPGPDIRAHGYEAMMAALEAQERPSWLASLFSLNGKAWSPVAPQRPSRLTFSLRLALLFLALIMISSVFVVTASAHSLPGDALYPAKRTWEEARLALTLSERSRQALASEFAEHRREEVRSILELRRPIVVEFEGVLQTAGDAPWLVDDLRLEVGPDAEVRGAMAVGQHVSVRAKAGSDGRLVALEIVGAEAGSPDATAPAEATRPAEGPPPTRETGRNEEPAFMGKATGTPTRQPTREVTATYEPTHAATATPTVRPLDKPTETKAPTNDQRPTPTPTIRPGDVTWPGDSPTREAEPTPTTVPTHEPTATDVPTATPKPRDKATATREPTATPTRKDDLAATREPTPTNTRNSDSGDSDRPP